MGLLETTVLNVVFNYFPYIESKHPIWPNPLWTRDHLVCMGGDGDVTMQPVKVVGIFPR